MFRWHTNLKVSKLQFFLQLLSAAIYVLAVLITLDILSESPIMWAVGSSSLASSAYLIFATPTAHTASAKRIVGAYFIAIAVGVVVRHFATWLMADHGVMLLGITHDPHMYWLSGSISVAISMCLMLLFSLEHPPAAGMALVMVIDQRSNEAIIAIFLLALLLAVIKMSFKKCLCNVT